MKLSTLLLFQIGLLSGGIAWGSAVHCVDAGNLKPVPPYTD